MTSSDDKDLSFIQSKAKVWYDRQARERTFEIGQLVLVFLPVPGKPLQTKYQGPFKIIGKRGPIDYVIETPNRRLTQRVSHVNMLKAYIERDWNSLCLNTTFVQSNSTLEVPDPDFGPETTHTNDTFSLDHLPETEREQLQKLLCQYADIFNDNPGKTNL